MSRNIRKLKQSSSAAKAKDESSDEEYEPFTRKEPVATFSGFCLSSASEGDNQLPKSSSEEENAAKPAVNQKKKKNNKQKQKKKPAKMSAEEEVAKCVAEVNAMLGSPSPVPFEEEIIPDEPDLRSQLFKITHRNLLSDVEFNRRFGPEEKPPLRRGRQPNLKYIHTYTIISRRFDFKRNGLSMTVDRREGDLVFFVFEHNEDYRIRHGLLPTVMNKDLFTGEFKLLELSALNMHIEGLIEAADKLFRTDRIDEAYDVIEKSIAYTQYFAHPGFNLTNINVRLEYTFFENRMFHILLLKYAYMTSNRACHRSGLELAKLLINLDPSDPLGAVLIIDGLALRAREYQWLVHAIGFIESGMGVGNLYNIKFSKALAYYHQSLKGLEKPDYADQLLQDALLIYPWALRPITEHLKVAEARIRSHEFFSRFANATTGDNLKKLIKFYAAFTAAQWREQDVMDWFLRNARAVTQQVQRTQFMMKISRSAKIHRANLFNVLPEQMHRHFAVINSMSNFIVGGEVPQVKFTHAYNPVPPHINMSRSGYPMDEPDRQIQRRPPLIVDFIESLFPSFRLDIYENYFEDFELD